MTMRTLSAIPAALLAACLLGGCASNGDTQSAFFKAEAGYTAVLQAAASYVALPRCVDNGPTVCSQQSVVDQIRPAANSADATITAAETTIRANPAGDAAGYAISAAQNAVQALSVILSQYGVK